METRPLSVFRALFLVASEFRFVKLVFGSFRFFHKIHFLWKTFQQTIQFKKIQFKVKTRWALWEWGGF